LSRPGPPAFDAGALGERDATGRRPGRVVCGIQAVREAIRAHGAKLERVAVEASPSVSRPPASGREGAPQLEALARYARDHGAVVDRLARSDLDKIARGVRHQGAIAFAPDLVIVAVDDVPVGDGTLVVALDEMQDPQNFGAVIRSAVAMGATAVMWPEHRSAPLSSATFRASAGAIEHATLCRVGSLPAALATLRARGVAVIGLDMTGDSPIERVDLSGPVVLVVGAEGKGLRRPVKSGCDALVRLPMPGPIDALNASAAVAIALYEVVRQRGAR
jgi:23S rRNA (guanosine2251-2'-O)-methyltransferase